MEKIDVLIIGAGVVGLAVAAELSPDMAGIRPKIQGPGDPFCDFIVCHEVERGFEGLINLIGIESPGLTSSLTLAKMVRELISFE